MEGIEVFEMNISSPAGGSETRVTKVNETSLQSRKAQAAELVKFVRDNHLEKAKYFSNKSLGDFCKILTTNIKHDEYESAVNKIAGFRYEHYQENAQGEWVPKAVVKNHHVLIGELKKRIEAQGDAEIPLSQYLKPHQYVEDKHREKTFKLSEIVKMLEKTGFPPARYNLALNGEKMRAFKNWYEFEGARKHRNSIEKAVAWPAEAVLGIMVFFPFGVLDAGVNSVSRLLNIVTFNFIAHVRLNTQWAVRKFTGLDRRKKLMELHHVDRSLSSRYLKTRFEKIFRHHSNEMPAIFTPVISLKWAFHTADAFGNYLRMHAKRTVAALAAVGATLFVTNYLDEGQSLGAGYAEMWQDYQGLENSVLDHSDSIAIENRNTALRESGLIDQGYFPFDPMDIEAFDRPDIMNFHQNTYVQLSDDLDDRRIDYNKRNMLMAAMVAAYEGGIDPRRMVAVAEMERAGWRTYAHTSSAGGFFGYIEGTFYDSLLRYKDEILERLPSYPEMEDQMALIEGLDRDVARQIRREEDDYHRRIMNLRMDPVVMGMIAGFVERDRSETFHFENTRNMSQNTFIHQNAHYYGKHMMGDGGYSTFYELLRRSPDTVLANHYMFDDVTSDGRRYTGPASANRPMFYFSNGRARTAAEFEERLIERTAPHVHRYWDATQPNDNGYMVRFRGSAEDYAYYSNLDNFRVDTFASNLSEALPADFIRTVSGGVNDIVNAVGSRVTHATGLSYERQHGLNDGLRTVCYSDDDYNQIMSEHREAFEQAAQRREELQSRVFETEEHGVTVAPRIRPMERPNPRTPEYAPPCYAYDYRSQRPDATVNDSQASGRQEMPDVRVELVNSAALRGPQG